MTANEPRAVLVTGGGTGLGKATAIRFARDGARVAICGRREEVLADAGAVLRDAGAFDVATFRCDVREDDQVMAMAEALYARWGRSTSS